MSFDFQWFYWTSGGEVWAAAGVHAEGILYERGDSDFTPGV